MRIRTPADLGALIRDSRTKLGLDQKSLAEKVGVSRQWIVEIEKGKSRASIGLLLRTIGAPASPSMQKKKVQENRRTPARLTVQTRTWTLIPSLPPRAGRENE